jgi:mono/diheme cytochrome c family protein
MFPAIMRAPTLIACAAAAAAAIGAALVLVPAAGEAQVGEAVEPTVEETAAAVRHYQTLCLPCHGTAGAGDGPAAPWLWPRPRDFTRAEYKWRSTLSGQPPTADDIARAIRHGVPGTSMHAFAPVLEDREVAALVRLLQGFAPDRFARPAEPVAIGEPPAIDAALLAEGKTAYSRLGCDKCHGAGGKGDGPAAAALAEIPEEKGELPQPTYDLTRHTFRRPRAPGSDRLTAIYTSLVTGLTGTPMPSYQGAAPERELWAVAAYVESLAAAIDRDAPNRVDVDPIAEALDRERNLTLTGYWPGSRKQPESRIWGRPIPRQGEPPEIVAPAQASLDAGQCGRCHAKQLREWTGTLHAEAGSPGLLAQIIPGSVKGSFVEGCQRCHNPLAEQHASVRPAQWGAKGKSDYRPNPEFDAALQKQGINCASCHVRGHVRHGPPRVAGSKLLEQPGYPLIELDHYERSDFCLACHQLTPDNLVEGRPLLNTYREWLEGPYMPRGIQCQHCHMPNREHTWKGVHDPETFRQGIDVATVTGRNARSGAVSVRVRVTNVGAGHYLPTTPTPAAWVSVELIDRGGRAIKGARAEKRIGRHIEYKQGWIEHEDTRIPPGQHLELAAAWKDGRVADAAFAEVVVRVEPDEYYERFYEKRLRGKLSSEARALYEQALERARRSHFVAVRRQFPIAGAK